MAERDVVKAVLKTLRDRGALVDKVHGDMYQPAVVDVVGCYRSIYIAFECKADSRGKLTPRQAHYLQQVRDASGVSAHVWNVEQVKKILDWIDRRLDSGKTLEGWAAKGKRSFHLR